MAKPAPSSNKQRKAALREKRERRAERASRRPPPDERARADQKLRASRRGTRNDAEAIRRMVEGEELDLPKVSHLDLIQDILYAARLHGVQEAALPLVHACLGSKLLADNPGPAREPILHTFLHLARQEAHWIRRAEDWRPARRNVASQLSELIRHLVARYPVPRFFDEAWRVPIRVPRRLIDFAFAGCAAEDAIWKANRRQGWFLHVASGQNLRTAPDLPFELTKRVAHCTLEAGDDLGIGQALRWGQARALDVPERVAEAFVLTRAGDALTAPGGERDNAFWVSVLRFLAPHRMLDPASIGPLVDYLIDQRYVPVPQRAGPERPEHPNLSMRGRTLEGLLERTEAWHRMTGRIERARGRHWAPLGILAPDDAPPASPGRFIWRAGSKRKPVQWTVVELLTSADLSQEGRALGHCVYSYAWSCTRGRSSIWSLRRTFEGIEERRATLEIQPTTRRLVQARGPRNRPPNPAEWNVIGRFAAAGGLAIPEPHRWQRAP